MVRTRILSTVFAVAISSLLPGQEQTQKKDLALQWAFAYAQTATRLVTLVSQDRLSQSDARALTWAICANPLKVTAASFAADTPASGGYMYDTTESIPQGSHCLLVDSTSHDAMFLWGEGTEPGFHEACVSGFSQAAEALTGRRVSSCYLIGGYGTGAIELIEYTRHSPKDALAALLIDNLRTPPPNEPQYWIAKFSAGEPGWASNDGKFHPEQFQHLFTIIDNSRNEPWTDVRFVGIEWDGPKGAELILYRPVGNELKPVIVNHDPGAVQAMTRR
jgi:hypothetical protein